MWQKFIDWLKALCASFQTKPVETTPAPAPSVSVGLQAPLTWDKKPERIAWSLALYNFIGESFDTLSKASDITKIRPDFHSLNRFQQITVLCELIVQMSYYESFWDPNSASQGRWHFR
jgi:hypothetical protein